MGSEIHPVIEKMMRDEEIENMQNRDGWAIGRVTKWDSGRIERTLCDAWIELFNGDGRAGEFGGVRFIYVDPDVDGDASVTRLIENDMYEEAYAYATITDLTESSTDGGWAVSEYTDPRDAEYGKACP